MPKVTIEVTQSYFKTTTIKVPRNGRSDDQLLEDYAEEIEEGIGAASLYGGETFNEVHDPEAAPAVTVQFGYVIRVKENGKLIGKDPEGYPNCVDKWAGYLKPWPNANAALAEIKGIGHWNLYNLGPMSNFTYEAIPYRTIIGE